MPKDPNIEFEPSVDFDSPPPPRDRPPKPEDVWVSLSSAEAVMSTEMVGVLIGGAVGGDWVGGCCCCCPKPKDVFPNADGVPEKALNPNAPPVIVAVDGEVVPNALGAAGAGDVVNALCCCATGVVDVAEVGEAASVAIPG